MFTVKITDELGVMYGYECESVGETLEVVADWLGSVGETPIYSVEITPKD